MTEVLFYHLLDAKAETVLPPLLEKSLERGWRAVVQASEARLATLDAHLWTFRDDSFLPHATAVAPDAAEQPIVLTADSGNINSAAIRFMLDDAVLPADCGGYERIVIVFDGNDDDAVASARAAWADCKARGFAAVYRQAEAGGGWRQRE